MQINSQASGFHDRMPAYTCGVPDQAYDIIFFDGDCAMCSRFVVFCLRRDERRVFRYAPIDGSTWNDRIEKMTINDRGTIHLLTGDVHLVRTSAIIGIFRELGGPWRFVGNTLWLIPRPIRNAVYRFVAWNRKRLSKFTRTCSIPNPNERSCILP